MPDPNGSSRRADADARGEQSSFPQIVTLLSLALALGIYMHGTRPALAEAERLDETERQLRSAIDTEIDTIEDERRRATRLDQSPEQVLVELDGRGISAAEADRIAEHDDPVDSESLPAGPARGR